MSEESSYRTVPYVTSVSLLSQTNVLYRTVPYRTVHNSIYQVDFPCCFMRAAVVFLHYPWNNQVFYYGTVQYSVLLYRTVG